MLNMLTCPTFWETTTDGQDKHAEHAEHDTHAAHDKHAIAQLSIYRQGSCGTPQMSARPNEIASEIIASFFLF